MADYRLVIPVLNRKVTGLVGPSWQLSAEVAIETILDEDHAAILRDPPADESDAVSITARVVNAKVGSSKPTKEEVLRLAARAQFCLNYFAAEPGVSMAWAFLVSPGKRGQMSVAECTELAMAPVAPVSRTRVFRFDRNTKRTSLVAIHTALDKALANYPGAIMAVDRFSRALSRSDQHDRLVDLCICLESLIAGSSELRYRFSQMHAMIAEPDASKRVAAFRLFSDFYDARSKVVHGDSGASAKVATVEARWSELIEYAKASLAYYFAYLSENNRSAWDEHIKKLCLGVETVGGSP